MSRYFRYEMPEEDVVVFSLTDAARHTPETLLVHELGDYIATHAARVAGAETPRAAELEARCTDFARLLSSHVQAGTTMPPRKSYTLKT